MQFASIKLLLRWFFREAFWKEQPKHLRSAMSACEVIGRTPARIQNVQDVMFTHNRCLELLKTLDSREILTLNSYYKVKRTMARIERDQYIYKSAVDKIEKTLEPKAIELKLISQPRPELPKYHTEIIDNSLVIGAKNISSYLGRSVSWFYQFGLKDVRFNKVLNKVGTRWEAKSTDLNKWKEG